RHHDVDVRIARIFNTFGPRMQIDDGRAIPNFFRQAIRGESVTLFGDGSQTRSFMYVDDLIEGVWRLLGSSYVGPVNLGNPEEMTLRAMADKIIAITGSASPLERLPLPPDDPKVRRPDISLARDVLGGWEPKISIEEGLRRTCDYFVTALARRDERDRREREQRERPGGERRRDPARRRATERKEPRP
ncbi:MAG TPA: NAD-dependent epimerase/dehydratase family protein, partial [Myxococcota bacterium]|nr:NAD-dependent epimerase/dehydratase family protein [Myxococcota bacterium]